MGNIKVSVIKPSDIQYNVYTDESGVFGLNFNSVIPREVQFSVNDTSFFLKKLPSNLSTYTFILDVK